ncbi:MAG: DUF1631 family protein [Betaproteobacteria bacterium]
MNTAVGKLSLLGNARDQLAEDFGHRIFNAAPEITECIRDGVEMQNGAADRKPAVRAMEILDEHRRELQIHATVAARRIFDEKHSLLMHGRERAARTSLDNLTLLSDERLDEEIAVSSFGRRLKEQCDVEYWALTHRIAKLSGMGHPPDRYNPVYPQTYAQALLEAIGALDTDSAVRLLVFRNFGPALLEIVPSIYAACNQSLNAAGIDIDISEYQAHVAVGDSRYPQQPALPEAGIDSVDSAGDKVENDQLAATLAQLLARSGSTHALFHPVVEESEQSKQIHGDSSNATALPDEIARSFLASAAPPPTAQTAPHAEKADPAWYFDLRKFGDLAAGDAVDNQVPSRTLHDTRHSLREKLTAEELVVNDIITVLFDRLLVEPRLPAKLRAVVARLQLPVLELALTDASLLTQVGHPVRRLIDLIAEFGLTIGEGADDDGIERSVANVVDGLVRIHRRQPNSFTLAFEQLDALFYHHEEAALQRDTNLRALEHSEAVDYARSRAEHEIVQRLRHLALPRGITYFLQTAWRDVLVHDYLHGGSRGEPWKLGLATLDDIIRSLLPSTDENERRRLARNLPSFIELLLNTPDSGADIDVIAANFFAELERIHALAAAGRWDEVGGEQFVLLTPATAVGLPASPSATLASLGLACGDWVEIRDFGSSARWRLNWITSIHGTCVFKHYETGAVRNMACAELAARLSVGEIRRARGLGLADDLMNDAFETISRKTRREESSIATRAAQSAAGATAPFWSMPLPRSGTGNSPVFR